MKKCSYADKYKAIRQPICGCDVCNKKWEEKLKKDGIELFKCSNCDTILMTRELDTIQYCSECNDIMHVYKK